MTSDRVNELGKIILRFGYEDLVRITRLDHHRLDQKPKLVQDLKLGELHVRIFSASEGALVPTEFRNGSASLALSFDFLLDLTKALLRTELDTLLGIKIHQERLNLDKNGNAQYTGWVVTGDGVSFQTGETPGQTVS